MKSRLPVYLIRAVLYAMCAVIVLAGGLLTICLKWKSNKESK